MEACQALVDGEALFALVRRLEPSGRVHKELQTGGIVGAISVALREDPGRDVLYVIAEQAPEARGDNGQRWVSERSEILGPAVSGRRTTLCTVVFPGQWPPQQVRHRVGQTPVRLVSAIHHLWADRLGIHDEDGNVDQQRQTRLLDKLGGAWTVEEERRYTEPALETVEDGAARSDAAKEALLRPNPDAPSGGVTVVYGPGGIGKTFFLRRVAHRMSRAALNDPTQGIPVFAELPLLLHVDALETWISHAGVRLPIADIEVLLAAGLIVPVLDALDELVRGQAREGSRQFLQHLKAVAEPRGKVVLSSRDYYLNLDPLVREQLDSSATAQLSVGFFSRSGRRRYIQMRTGLADQDAAKWAGQLETQAHETLAGLTEADVESLIGHPLFLDAFCQIILAIPAERRVSEAAEFRITSPDVFGDIVEKVLVREHEKVKAGWDAKFADALIGPWADPFTPELQREVFRELVLRVAGDGAAEVMRREGSDPRYRQLRHGLFTFTAGVPSNESPRQALKDTVVGVLGSPQAAGEKSVDEQEALAEAALEDYVGSLLQHTLADTRSNPPPDLVFATRHRAYFDYLLADELLTQLQATIASSDSGARETFIEWCLQHHLFERADGAEAPFASCLDFALWHRTALTEALAAMDQLFEPSSQADQVLTSYVVSLALAVAMRASIRTGHALIRNRDFAPDDAMVLELVESIVPIIANVTVRQCSLPQLWIRGLQMRDTEVEDSDINGLLLADVTMSNVRIRGSCRGVGFSGTSRFVDCTFDLEEIDARAIVVDPAAVLSFKSCHFSELVMEALTAAAHVRRDVIDLADCNVIQRETPLVFSPGRVFVNRLMSLARKHGHREYGVYIPKLRGLSQATANTFPGALGVLRQLGVAELVDEIVCLTPAAVAQMYSGKGREGMRPYEDVADYWDPIVSELDSIL